MLVYGDRTQIADPHERLADIQERLRAVAEMPRGLVRHSALVTALIAAGQLLQGVADADFAQMRADRRTPATEALGRFVHELAAAVVRSWDSGFEEVGALAPTPKLSAPAQVELKTPEGFAFYGVYPEVYADAARHLKLSAPPRVIGIRSIGTTLGAVVAAALNAPPAINLRPFGDPFARKIAIDAELHRELLHGDFHYVIVDEGPGQSGSSFGAVADWLDERGVPLERLAFLPSHAGPPGPQASEAHRQRWNLVQRVPGDFGERLPALLSKWVRAPVEPVDAPLKDVSAGEWRRLVFSREEDWPATVPAWERRKFLAHARGEPFLLRFAGLGAFGEEKLQIARTLHASGFTPEPLALVHGFLVERWCADAHPLACDRKPIGEIGRYIGARARLLPAHPNSGATVNELLAMCRRNASVEFGAGAAAALHEWERRAGELERMVRRGRTDNKLDRHEWVRSAGGRLLKTDALDHHCAHDLIGCQDIAWDLAGAIVEFDLDARQTREIIDKTEQAAARRVERPLLDFYLIAYRAFRLGQARLGAQMCVHNAAESGRLNAAGDRYAAELQQLLLESTRPGTRLESLVG